jgi:hypothetical protein
MPDNSFTEISEQSWFGRLAGAIKGIVFGFIIFIVAFPVIFWNEGRAVKTYRTLKEGARVVVPIAEDRVDPANEGKLVHLTGMTATKDILEDGEFGIAANAIKLKRTVQMYQWKENKSTEERKKLGGGTTSETTYSYQKVWSDNIIDSSHFKRPQEYVNPTNMAYMGQEYVSTDVKLGAFSLSRSLINKINSFEDMEIQNSLAHLPSALQGKIKVQGNSYYVGTNPQSPEIGDLRIAFQIIRPRTLSIISRQIGNSFEPYYTKAGEQIELLQVGDISVGNMFETAQKENSILTWILRFVGFVLFFIGLFLILNPLSVLADVIPFIGSIIGGGVFIVAFLLALAFSLVTISIAWLVYRPILSLSLLVAIGIVCWALKCLKGGQKVANSQAVAAVKNS